MKAIFLLQNKLDIGRRFTQNGYILTGADMRGHGRTGGKRGHIPSEDAVLQDIDRTGTLLP